jgi:hypothetical protein
MHAVAMLERVGDEAAVLASAAWYKHIEPTIVATMTIAQCR